jgi:asparagine synthase (glutamine-hydrolysing)
MCGIAGEIRFDQTMPNLEVTRRMCDAQVHRGPDDDGYFTNGQVSLGIRRLAIIDLTKGLYPLTNEDATIQLIFNGEIYDFAVTRKKLEAQGHKFRSGTDAEVIIHAYESWGTDCLKVLNGMFAFALWDQRKQMMLIARDNFGIKPLHYYHGKHFLAFASEIKPLLTHPEISVAPNDRVIERYLREALVDNTEETFFNGISRLPAAHLLMIKPDGSLTRESYWSPYISTKLDGKITDQEVETTSRLFRDAVSRQLVSDVPVGTCLSGGIDSSSIVCTIKKVSPLGTDSTGEHVKTFTASFPGSAIDETDFARSVCDATGAEFNQVTPTADEFWLDLPALVRCQEEPFLSTSIYAQWRVMKRAKERGLTVLLDGQGGDEVLCGYLPYYIDYLATLKRNKKYGRLIYEGLLSSGLTWRFIIAYVGRVLSQNRQRTLSTLLSEANEESKIGRKIPARGYIASLLESHTTSTSLPALLRYEDKNSMCHSIEARVPFLDRPFFEYIAALPLDRKLRNGWTKYIFRKATRGILPDKIRLRRSKIGFETPEKVWIRHDLRERLRAFFSASKLQASRFYKADAVKTLLNTSKLTDYQVSLIWRILNLELWYREFFGDNSL